MFIHPKSFECRGKVSSHVSASLHFTRATRGRCPGSLCPGSLVLDLLSWISPVCPGSPQMSVKTWRPQKGCVPVKAETLSLKIPINNFFLSPCQNGRVPQRKVRKSSLALCEYVARYPRLRPLGGDTSWFMPTARASVFIRLLASFLPAHHFFTQNAVHRRTANRLQSATSMNSPLGPPESCYGPQPPSNRTVCSVSSRPTSVTSERCFPLASGSPKLCRNWVWPCAPIGYGNVASHIRLTHPAQATSSCSGIVHPLSCPTVSSLGLK